MCLSENFYPCLLSLRIHVLSDFDIRNGSFALFLLCFKARTTDTQRELLFKNPKLLGLSRHFGLKCFEAFGVFSAKLSAPVLVHVFHPIHQLRICLAFLQFSSKLLKFVFSKKATKIFAVYLTLTT